MKWIKYKLLQCLKGEEPVLIDKKVGYSEKNLAIAQTEAHDGEYTIEEDGETFEKEPLAIEHGGTAARNPEHARENLGAAAGFRRILTSSDDLDKIKEEGVFQYYTSGIPKNCPYSNAGLVEVIKGESKTSCMIQRVTRYGDPGYVSERILDNNGNWRDWGVIPLVFKKVNIATTNTNGNANTGVSKDNFIVLRVVAVDANGNETYICHPYKTETSGGRWYVNICEVTSKSNVASTEFTLTTYYINAI